ncbi:MAG: hypothetical protein V3574_01160 [Candidatus Moraniibacteriota bacterium]
MKKEILIGAIFLGLVGIIWSWNAQAEEYRSDKIAERKIKLEEKRSEVLCGRIDEIGNRLQKRMSGINFDLKDRVENKVSEMRELARSREVDLEERRIERDEERNDFYLKLSAQAGDDQEKKEAVERFKKSVEAAVLKRRLAIDEAKSEMNLGIDEALKKRTEEMEALRFNFEKDLEKIIDEARKTCSGDLKISELKESVRARKNEYKNDISEVKKVQTSIQALRENRKAEVKEAIETFKSEMKTAQEKLGTAMTKSR